MDGLEGICWLVSYPKSGNTWTRILLSRLLDAHACVGDDALSTGDSRLFSARPVFDQLTGLDSTELSDVEIDLLRAPAYRQLASIRRNEGAGPLFIKVHDAFSRDSHGEPVFPPDVSIGAIYLVRDPRDVAVSYTHHKGHGDFERTVKGLNSPTQSLGGYGRPQLRQWTYGWSGHYRSWHDQQDIPVLTVRYEDMLADTARELGRMAQFLGLPTADDPALLAAAVDASRFDRLQSLETQQGFSERPEASRSFFRSGKAGEGRSVLPEALQHEICDAHGALMAELGYLPATGQTETSE